MNKQKFNPIGYILGIQFIVLLLFTADIFEIFFFYATIVWTDQYVPAAQLSIFNPILAVLKSQNDYLGFNFWVFTFNYVAIFGYTIAPTIFLFALSKVAYFASLVVAVLVAFVEILRIGYCVFIIFSCADYVICRGRNYSGTPSVPFWYMFFNRVGHVVFLVITQIVIVLMTIRIAESKRTGMAEGQYSNARMEGMQRYETHMLPFHKKAYNTIKYVKNQILESFNE